MTISEGALESRLESRGDRRPFTTFKVIPEDYQLRSLLAKELSTALTDLINGDQPIPL